MTPLFMLDAIEQFSPLRFGAWAFFLLGALWIYKALNLGHRVGSFAKMAGFALAVLGFGLATGVLGEFDLGRLVAIVGTAVDIGTELLRRTGVLG